MGCKIQGCSKQDRHDEPFSLSVILMTMMMKMMINTFITMTTDDDDDDGDYGL